jgi:hypothetical protein
MAVRIQALVRRFLGRLEYHERVRLREMERKRRRVKEIKLLLEEIQKSKIAELESMNVEFEKRRVKERESFFDNFKVAGRREMLETRKMVAMKPQLHRQSKSLKAKRQEIHAETEKLSNQTDELETQTANLQVQASEYEKLIVQDSKALAETEQLCLIESTIRKNYERGLSRIVNRVEKAVPADVELVETLKDMANFCLEVSKMCRAAPT